MMSSYLPRIAIPFLGAIFFFTTGCQQVRESAVFHGPPAKVYETKPGFTQTGIASYYAGRWIGRKTANGERYMPGDITAAHRTLPFNTLVRVTNLSNGKSVIVRINNRGPFTKDRIIDLSLEAAKRIDMVSRGITKVKVETVREIPVMKRPNIRTFSRPESAPVSRESGDATSTGGSSPSQPKKPRRQ